MRYLIFDDDYDDHHDTYDDADEDDDEDGWWSPGILEHILVFDNGEVDGIEDGAVLVEGPGVNIDEVGDLCPVPPGINSSLTHHGRGIAEWSTSSGSEKEHNQVPEQDQANTHQ